MLIQVHGQEKPAIRRRTIAASITLLAISIGLAASLTWESNGIGTEFVIVPHGWTVSVRPPPGAVARTQRGELGRGFLLEFPTTTGAIAQLTVRRLADADATDLQAAAEGVFSSSEQRRPHAVGNLPVVWHDKSLGNHEAVELWDPRARYVVRVGRVRSGELYAVGFDSFRNPPGTYEIFDRFCHSFEDLAE